MVLILSKASCKLLWFCFCVHMLRIRKSSLAFWSGLNYGLTWGTISMQRSCKFKTDSFCTKSRNPEAYTSWNNRALSLAATLLTKSTNIIRSWLDLAKQASTRRALLMSSRNFGSINWVVKSNAKLSAICFFTGSAKLFLSAKSSLSNALAAKSAQCWINSYRQRIYSFYDRQFLANNLSWSTTNYSSGKRGCHSARYTYISVDRASRPLQITSCLSVNISCWMWIEHCGSLKTSVHNYSVSMLIASPSKSCISFATKSLKNGYILDRNSAPKQSCKLVIDLAHCCLFSSELVN